MAGITLLTQFISLEADIILARQRARQISRLLGFDTHYQIRLATAVSELVREVFLISRQGVIEYIIEEKSTQLRFIIQINTKTIQEGKADLTASARSATALQNAQRLVSYFDISNTSSNGTIRFGEIIPIKVQQSLAMLAADIAKELAKQTSQNPYEELHQQNQELIETVAELKQARDLLELRVQERTQELASVNAVLVAEIEVRKRIELEIRELNLALEERVVQRTVQLQNANAELEAFSYSLSHDLRAPLRVISGFNQLLRTKLEAHVNSDTQELFDGISVNVDQISALINGLLNFFHAANGKLKKDPVDLSQLCHQINYHLQTTEPERQVEVIIEENILVEGDALLLNVMLTNIFSNAWKFTSHRKDAQIQFGSTLIEDGKVYFVRDNGVGFDMAYSHRLFDPFQRLHHSSEFSGTGIGLATVKRIITRHEGRIWAESEIGVGTTFYFTLTNI